MRIALLIVVLAASLAIGGTPAAAGDRDPARCKAKESKTLVKTRYVRVFETPGAGEFDSKYMYGCLYSRGKRIKLDEAEDADFTSSEAYDLVTVAGRFVAWRHERVDLSCKGNCPPGYDTNPNWIEVYDLRNRTRRRIHLEAEPSRLVAATTGGVAWLVQGAQLELRASDADGERLLDAGAIDPGSLSVRGRILSWLNAGQARSTKLR